MHIKVVVLLCLTVCGHADSTNKVGRRQPWDQDVPVELSASPKRRFLPPTRDIAEETSSAEDSDAGRVADSDQEEETSSTEDSEPTWSDYVQQQRINAELAEKVAEFTRLQLQLVHQERALKKKALHQIKHARRTCRHEKETLPQQPTMLAPVLDDRETVEEDAKTGPSASDVQAATAALKSHMQSQEAPHRNLPWSLTHAGSSHHRMYGHAAASGTGPLDAITGMFSRSSASPEQASDLDAVVAQRNAEVTRRQDKLAEARAQLGRDEEASIHLKEQVRVVEEQISKADKAEIKRLQDIASLETHEKADEEELQAKKVEKKKYEEIKHVQETKATNANAAQTARIAAAQKELLGFRKQADTELHSKELELSTAQTQLAELKQKLKIQEATEKALNEQLVRALQADHKADSGLQSAIKRHGEVQTSEAAEEQRLINEDEKLQGEQTEEHHCKKHGQRLEVRLKQELESKVKDAQLCRDGIRSLHAEKVETKEQVKKLHQEVEDAKLRSAEANKNYEENQGLLDHCISHMS